MDEIRIRYLVYNSIIFSQPIIPGKSGVYNPVFLDISGKTPRKKFINTNLKAR